MTPAFDSLVALLKRLPGVGYRSAERMALHLLLERPEELLPLMAALENAHTHVHACVRCGNLAQQELCELCTDSKRDPSKICIVERVPDLVALERAGVYRGLYHVLGGRLSPISGIGPQELNIWDLHERITKENPTEIVLALSNDIEGEATCHYISHELLKDFPALQISRIAFGVPSGASLTFSDQVTLRSALEGRREMAR